MSDQSNAEENPLITPATEQPIEEAPQEQEQPTEAASNEPAPPKKEAWYMKEIGALRAANQEKERLLRDYQAKFQPVATHQPANNAVPTAQEITPEFIDQLADAKAAQKLAAQTFNKACDDIYDKGTSEFSNFKDAVESLGSMGALSDNQGPTPLLQSVLEVPNSHKVLHHLAQNPEEVQRIKVLSPLKQAIEIANIANKLSGPVPQQPVSRVGAPIKPVNGVGKAPASIEDTSMPIEEWMKLNEKHEQELRSRRY